jgi:hypothetical protein
MQSVFSTGEEKNFTRDNRGIKKGNVTRKYQISPSTLSISLKDTQEIKKSIDSNSTRPQAKRTITANDKDVDKAAWFLDPQLKTF